MRLGLLVFFGFAMGLVLYLLGYTALIDFKAIYTTNGILTILNSDCGHSTSAPTNINIQAPACQDQKTMVGLLLVFLLVGGVIVSLLTGFSAIYYIPILMLIAVATFFIFPFSFLLGAPELIRYPTIILLNLFTALAVISFIRGGNV